MLFENKLTLLYPEDLLREWFKIQNDFAAGKRKYNYFNCGMIGYKVDFFNITDESIKQLNRPDKCIFYTRIISIPEAGKYIKDDNEILHYVPNINENCPQRDMQVHILTFNSDQQLAEKVVPLYYTQWVQTIDDISLHIAVMDNKKPSVDIYGNIRIDDF